MIDLRIKYNGVKLRVRGFTNRKLKNVRILEVGLASVKARLAKGIGSDDGPTAPLSPRYQKRKVTFWRGKPIRDLRLTGSFLDTFLPRYADDDRAVAYAGGRLGRLKAVKFRNEINFSASDQRAMSGTAARLFREDASQVFEPLTGGGRGGHGRFGKSDLFRRAA